MQINWEAYKAVYILSAFLFLSCKSWQFGNLNAEKLGGKISGWVVFYPQKIILAWVEITSKCFLLYE